MSEANAPFDSTNQPESNQPGGNPPESRVESTSSGRPKAFSELKALTDLAQADSGENLAGSAEPRSIWHNIRQNARSTQHSNDETAGQPSTSQQSSGSQQGSDPSFSHDEIEFDISKIFDASDLDGLAFEAEAAPQPNLVANLAEVDLWADSEPLAGEVEVGTTGFTAADADLENALKALNLEPNPSGAPLSSAGQTADLATAAQRPAANLPEDELTDASSDSSTESFTTEGFIEDSSLDNQLSTEVPSLASLIGLIQELNQCNGVLMDRVSQLEEALESSQSALQAEVGRIHDTELGQDWNNSQDWATVQDQVANLFNQLEFAHQTNQRQQILIETLTSQLENSQERVAQLEREAALIQQRYDEQAQLLVKSEHTNRDLQARLQRQQRYTLQFKVALERSLEVAAPSYETSLYEVNPIEPKPALLETAEVQFLPKAKQIQPWSAQSQLPLSQSIWTKLQSSLSPTDGGAAGGSAAIEGSATSETLETGPAFLSIRSTQPPQAKPETGSPAAQDDAPATTHLHLPTFGMPLLQFSQAEASTPDRQPDSTLSDPMLNQLDEVVKPLADMLAEAMLAGTSGQTINDQTVNDQAVNGQAIQPNPQLNDRANPQPNPQVSEPASQPLSTPNAHPDELLASVMADAEDALWQDLARLIDVSTEDVVKASLSGDLAAFESIDFAALSSSAAQAEPPANWRTDESTASGETDAADSAPLLHRHQPIPPSNLAPTAPDAEPVEDDSSDQTALAPASWPSPVVYPLRPVKKRQSLAMVDLPTFPRG
jgi:hypothetical protein